MTMYKFGTRSEKRMQGVRVDLCMCARLALSRSKYDMTIPWMGGVRTADEQHKLYQDGNSNADGYEVKSYHQTGNALDVIPVARNMNDDPYKNDKAFYKFAQVMFAAWQELLVNGKVTGTLYWGGHFGSTGWDKPHWEVHD